MPLDHVRKANLRISGEHHVAIDNINSYPYDLFLPTDVGEISEQDKKELKARMMEYLPLR